MTTTTTTPAPAKNVKTYDTSKIGAALTATRATIKTVIDQCVADKNFGKSSPLRDLATLDSWLVDAETKLANVGKPRVKKERKAKAAK